MKKQKKKKRPETAPKNVGPPEKDFIADKARIERYKAERRKFWAFFYTVVLHVRTFLRKNTEDNINALSAQSAFFLILSLIPSLMFILSVISLFGGKPNTNALQNMPDSDPLGIVSNEYTINLRMFLQHFVEEAYEHASSGMAIVTAIMALWSAGKGLYIITDGISRIYGIRHKHIWLLRRVYAMGYTAVLMLMLLIYFFLVILNAFFDIYLRDAVGDLSLLTEILFGLRYVIASILLIILMTVALKLYLRGKVKDKRYAKFRVLLPGMIFTGVSWGLLSWGVDLYSKYFTSSMYGSLGSIFVYLMWIYFMMLLLLYGIQINFVYRENFYRFRFFAFMRKHRKKKKQKAASP